MSEETAMANPTIPEYEPEIKKIPKKRDIFRFKGQEDMSINLDHVQKINRKEKRIAFQLTATADYVDFETDEAAANAYENIIAVWSSDV